jgi:serine/threonine protein kinase
METYGSYQLIKRLATGGMAQIYLARQKGLEGFEKLLVVKRILPHLAENADFVRMFLDEARIAARLNHPNIVQIFNLGAQDDSYFIAMEYIHGEDVRRVWKRSEQKGTPMPIQLVCRVIMEACNGLDYAHKKTDQNGKPLGIVHRDVSPQNILVTFEGGVKVVDFGIAKAADQAVVTRSGVLKGKYSYMSPEQALGKKLDQRSDIFALGVVLYELLTGTRLFKRANDIQTLNAVTECVVPPPSEVDEDIPKDLDPIVLKALGKEPEQRYDEAIQLQMALEEWLLKHQLPSSSAHLAAFMQELYAERLAEEKAAGQVLVEELDSLSKKNEEESPPSAPPPPPPPPKSKARQSKMTAFEGISRRGDREPSNPQPPAAPEVLTPLDKISRSFQAPVMARTEMASGPPPTKDPERTEEVPPPGQPGYEPPRGGAPAPRVAALHKERDDSGESSEALTHTTEAGVTPYRKKSAPRAAWAPPTSSGVPVAPIAAVLGVLALLGGGAFLLLRPKQQSPAAAVVRIASEPSEATVLFNGRPVPELTPCTLPPSPAGTYPLVVGKRGYLDFHTTVTVPEVGQITVGPVKLERDRNQPLPPGPAAAASQDAGGAPVDDSAVPKVEVTLSSEPSGAAITIDGQSSGRTPRAFLLPAQSEVTVRMEYPGYAPLTQQIRIGTGLTQEEMLRLDKLGPNVKVAKGRVRFTVTPWASISCGGMELGATPLPEKELPAGVYQCKFTHPEHGTRTERVEVKPNSVAKVSVRF